MPTEEHDSWLGNALGIAVDKLRSATQTLEDEAVKAKDWVEKKADEIKDGVNKAEDWADGELKKGADWVKTEASNVAGAVKKGADALKMKALGDQSGKAVPRPMEEDCKPEHGYVPGPSNHLLCSTHGHVVDTDKRMIIANSVAAYLKQGAAAALQSADLRADVGSGGTAPPANAPSGADSSGELSPALLKQASDFLDTHRFRATKSAEVVPGDKTCDVWLDDHVVKQEEVRAAVTKANPALANDPIGLAHFVSSRWDDEIHQALVQSGNWPGLPKPPDGVLHRKRDGHIYWAPNPAPATMGGTPLPPAPDDWATGFLEFYDIEPTDNAADAGKACVFDSDPSTITAVVALLTAQASLAGYAANASAQSIAIKLCADHQTAKAAGDILDRITKKLAAKQDLGEEIGALNQLDMKSLLEVLTRLRKAGVFEDMANYGPKFSNRLGAAFYTVDENYGEEFQKRLAKLSDDDRAVILERVPPPNRPGGGGGNPDENGGWQTQIGGALQYAVHGKIDRKGIHPGDPNDVTLQTSIGLNYSGHKKDASGPELQAVLIQFSYNATTGQISKVSGVQGALVSALWKKFLQVQGIGSVLAGVASSGKSQEFTFQAQVGIQLLVTLGPVQIGIQGSGGITYTSGSPIDLPGAGSLVIQGSF